MRIALLQFAPQPSVLDPNLAVVLDGATRAADQGADLLIAPEMSLTGWVLRDAALRERLARDVRDVALPALEDVSRRLRLGIVVGGPMPVEDGLANCVLGFAPDGQRSVYQKTHLFGEEADWWTPGSDVSTLSLGNVEVGLLICYDAEFPEMPRLARLAGAQLIAVPATNMHPYAHDQELLFPTRALENECVVAVCNRIGAENGWRYFGRSLVADARGRIVAQAQDEEGLLFADVDLSASNSDPNLSYLVRRRPDVYRGLHRRFAVDAPSQGG